MTDKLSLTEYQALTGHPAVSKPAPVRSTPKAKGRRHERGRMNGTETAFFNEVVTPKLRSGEWLKCWFEAVTFRLAEKCSYTVDFMVLAADDEIILFEIKAGYTPKSEKSKPADQRKVKTLVEDDAAVKMRLFTELFPFRFFIATKRPANTGGGWDVVER